MYAAAVIKSYERFADYVRLRLNAPGYENIVVVSISAIISVYAEKFRQLIDSEDNNSLDRQLKNLRRQYKGTDQATAISFVEKFLETLEDFHGKEIENLEQLKQTSRVNYLIKVAESMYDPAEQFEWIDETFEDVFDSDEEFFERVLAFAEAGDADAMDFAGVLYNIGHGVNKDKGKAFNWFQKAAKADYEEAFQLLAEIYYSNKNYKKAVECFSKAASNTTTNLLSGTKRRLNLTILLQWSAFSIVIRKVAASRKISVRRFSGTKNLLKTAMKTPRTNLPACTTTENILLRL